MTRPVEELYEQASHLSAEDRAELAGKLLESIEDPPDEGVEEAWAAEIERRMIEASVTGGGVTTTVAECVTPLRVAEITTGVSAPRAV